MEFRSRGPSRTGGGPAWPKSRTSPHIPIPETRSSVAASGVSSALGSRGFTDTPLPIRAFDGRREPGHQTIEQERQAEDGAERERTGEGLFQEEVAALFSGV